VEFDKLKLTAGKLVRNALQTCNALREFRGSYRRNFGVEILKS